MVAGLLLSARWVLRRVRRYRWSGRNAVVTGGSRGLGLEVVRLLVARGARVAVVAREAAEIDRALDDVRRRNLPGLALGFPCELTADGAVEGMLDRVRRDLAGIDVLINNAGAIQVGPLDATELHRLR